MFEHKNSDAFFCWKNLKIKKYKTPIPNKLRLTYKSLNKKTQFGATGLRKYTS